MIRFSVVVPVFEHWHLIPHLLAALDAQDYAGGFEVILVDNGSPDFAPPANLPDNTRILRCAAPGSYNARNVGAASASGEALAFTDADCLPAPGWLSALEAAMAAMPEADLFAGDIQIFPEDERRPSPVEIVDIANSMKVEVFFARGAAVTANLAVRRAVFVAQGGFDGSRLSGGDFEFCRRAGAAGRKLVLVPQATVRHPARRSWGELATKTRRLAGARARSPSRPRAVAWVWRLGYMGRDTLRVLALRRYALGRRIMGVAVVVGLAAVYWAEMARVRAGGLPERR